jgi:outer membrane protein, heavy metal efflux system
MKRIFLMVAVSAAASLAAVAQTVITEQDFLSVLDESHPAVVAAAEDAALARAALIDLRSFDNPTVGITREEPGSSIRQTDLTLSWQLPHANRALRAEVAEKELEAAEARLEHALRGIRIEARGSYAAWAIAAETRERLTRQLERMNTLTSRERLRADRGESSGLELHRLVLAASSLRAEVALAFADETTARGLARAWNPGLPADARPALPPLPEFPPGGEGHPLIRAAEADVAAAEATQDAAARYLRSPELMAGWQRQEAGGESLTGPLVGVYWQVPLFRRNQFEKAGASARLDAARGRLEQTRREIDARRRSALDSYQKLAAGVREIEGQSAATEQMLRGAEASFVLGETSLTDLLETWRSAVEVERARLALHEASLRALHDLERVTIRNNQNEEEIQP